MSVGHGHAHAAPEVLRWFSDKVRSAGNGGLSPTETGKAAKLHFGGSAFGETDMKSLLAFAMSVPHKLVDMVQALHFALVSPTVMRLPAKAFGRIAALPKDYPYAKVTRTIQISNIPQGGLAQDAFVTQGGFDPQGGFRKFKLKRGSM